MVAGLGLGFTSQFPKAETGENARASQSVYRNAVFERLGQSSIVECLNPMKFSIRIIKNDQTLDIVDVVDDDCARQKRGKRKVGPCHYRPTRPSPTAKPVSDTLLICGTDGPVPK